MMEETKQLLDQADLKMMEEGIEFEDTFDEEAYKEILDRYLDKDKEHVWAFCAGQYSQDFRGNPKYLFIYINKYRPDIYAYWLCDNADVIEMIRRMGYPAVYNGTSEAAKLLNRTGVLVAEQVKAEIPAGLEHAKYLNLWHGVGGVKAVERSITEGLLVPELARKYIRRNEYYRTYELYVAPSAFIEGIAKEQLGLTDKQIIHAGYARDLYQKNYERIATFDHNIIENRSLPEDTRIATYIPTRREFDNPAFFAQAFPDMDKLIELCEKKHILFVFKMHPYYEKDALFLAAKQKYEDCPWLLFWNNADDIYEILDRIDLCIMDFSSMFTDMMVAGVKHFIRYAFDFDNEDLEFPMDYDKVTPGPKCKTYEELLNAIEHYETEDISESLEYINNLYWEYSSSDSMDVIIDKTIEFKPEKPKLRTLYSFDIFDTVFSRKVLDPVGIFYKIKELMEKDGSFPQALVCKYPSIHKDTEQIIREYYKKSTDIRNSEKLEISLDEILERIGWVYGLSADQVEKLRNWEIETEIDNVIPLHAQIDLIKKYLEQGDEVILVSDMYLPKDVITRMLEKADPVLTQLPLFLSNEYGVLKAHKSLFFEVYKSFKPYYDFKKWIHYGDNIAVDQNAARACGINTRRVFAPEFNAIQQELVKYTDSYDGYLVAALQSRLCAEYTSDVEQFIASYITLIMVPYVDWALRDALRKGYETLYFISRDGHPLKRIADAIIEERGLHIKTKLIYASRRTWRIPSFIHEVDPCFWQAYANFGDIISSEKLLKAMSLDEDTFHEFFPAIDLDNIDYTDKKSVPSLVEQFKASKEYNQYLLDLAAKERVLVSAYLKQEIDPNEKFAIVEYWGRGYTQDTMVRLWRDITGEECDVPFYYSRTVLPSANGAIRYNFTTNSTAQFFIEGFFANMPYKSIERYQMEGDRIVPVIEPIPYNRGIYEAMQTLLPLFAHEYAKLPLSSPENTDHLLYDFALNYYSENRDNEEFARHIGSMVDSVAAYGKKREFAPPLTHEVLNKFAKKEMMRGDSTFSTCITMSIIRSEEDVKEKYFEMYQILPGDDIAKGRLLTQAEMSANKQAKKQYTDLHKRIEAFKNFYKDQAENIDVSNTVMWVFEGKTIDPYAQILMDRIKRDTFFKCEFLLLGEYTQKDDKAVAGKLASAKVVIAGNPIPLFSELTFRMETEYILLPPTPFNLYNAGYTQFNNLAWKQKLIQLMSRNCFDQVMIPSKQEEKLILSRFGTSGQTKCDILGNYVTDCYFDPEYTKRAKKRVNSAFPESISKKIILYMPTYRIKSNFTEWIEMLDLERLQELVGEDYVVVVNYNASQIKNECINIIEIPGFSKNINQIALRELIAAADVIVGDYRDTFFETPLLHKPVFSTAKDYENMIRSANMSQNSSRFEELLFCPIVESAEELAENLKDLQNYDYTKMENFQKEVLASCDGKSSERLISYLAGLYDLNDEQKEDNEKWKNKYLEIKRIGERFNSLYLEKCKVTSISDKIVFLTEKKNLSGTGLEIIYNRISESYNTQICCIDKGIYENNEQMEKIAEDIAAARLIISNNSIKLLCDIKLREKSDWLLIKDNPYPLAKRSHRKKYRSNWRSEYEKLTERCNCTLIQIPAPEQVEAYTNLYLNELPKKEQIIWGCTYTDLYFDNNKIRSAKEKLLKRIGDIGEKKIILYMPTVGNIKERNVLPIDLEDMRAKVSDDYVIVMNLKKNQKEAMEAEVVIPSGCYEVNEGISLMELIMASDVVVGDYRNTFFEVPLLRKPCFSTAFDASRVMKASSGSMTLKDIEEIRFCPIIKSADEMKTYVETLMSYDYSNIDLFRVRMLAFCDGRSTERVIEKIRRMIKSM